MCYIGSRGSVIIGDKRRVGFLGDEKAREMLEEELYSGSIKTKEELVKRAAELQISLKISDNAEKVREIGDVVVGEVKFKTPFETRRKRIYGTTGYYNIVKLLGSEIKRVQGGESSIVVFGNKITKEMANQAMKQHWKTRITLKEIGEIFKQVMEEVAQTTPSVSPEYDLIIKHPPLNKKDARELLRSTILQDVKELGKWRDELREDMLKKAQSIQMASKIIDQGEVGRVRKVDGNQIEIELGKGVEALDLEWNILSKPGEMVLMETDQPEDVSVDDVVVIEKEDLCIKRTKSSLTCGFILCRADK